MGAGLLFTSHSSSEQFSQLSQGKLLPAAPEKLFTSIETVLINTGQNQSSRTKADALKQRDEPKYFQYNIEAGECCMALTEQPLRLQETCCPFPHWNLQPAERVGTKWWRANEGLSWKQCHERAVFVPCSCRVHAMSQLPSLAFKLT